jgi:lipopolysaccharide export system protein LptA
LSRTRSTRSIREPWRSSPAVALRVAIAAVLVALAAHAPAQTGDGDDTTSASPDPAVGADDADWVVGSAEEWEEDAALGRRLLKGKVRIDREDGSGHLYADEVEMFYDPDGDSRKVDTMQARGNVNLREADFLATSDTADFTDGTAVIDLTGSVVVFIDRDRMEADRFRYDRRTGKKNAQGNVKFRFRLPSQEGEAPADPAAETDGEAAGAETTDDATDAAGQADAEQHGGSED